MEKKQKKKVFSVTTSVSEGEHHMYRVWAERNGTTVSEWARKVLLAAVPSDIRATYLGVDPVEAALTTWHAPDVNSAASVAPLPKESATSPDRAYHMPKDPLQELMEAPRDPLHTCAYIKHYFMGNMTARDCIGTCSSSRQMGKPCHWPSAAARSCSEFRSYDMR